MDAITKIETCVNDSLELAKKYYTEEKIKKLSLDFQKKRSEDAINILIFGSYNAGKSSLINALTGDDEAKVGDVPTTAEVKSYPWNGCVLLDTPGVNAPIEHEEITDDQVKKSQMVLFVIRAGDQDCRDIYERMFLMIKDGKQVFIALNHNRNSEEQQALIDKLYETILDFANKEEVEDKKIAEIPIVSVNLRAAIKARKGNKELLEKNSGILELESSLGNWIREYDSESKFIERLKLYARDNITSPLMNCMSASQSDSVDKNLENNQYVREDISRKYMLIDADLKNMTTCAVNNRKSEIARIISSENSIGGKQAELQHLCEGVSKEVSENLQKKLDDIINDAVSFNPSVELNISSVDDGGTGQLASSVEQVAVSGLKQIDKKMITEGLKTLREWKVPMIKGRWEKTLGKWAGRAQGALQVALAGYEIFKANESQERANSEARRQVLDMNQAVESIANEIKDNICSQIGAEINKIKEKSLQPINEEINSILKNKDDLTKDIEALKLIITRLQSVFL